MMQSVALFDSVLVPNDDEWIVLHTSSPNDDQVLADDSSYDYCDDVYSVLSNSGVDFHPIQDYLGQTIHGPFTIRHGSLEEDYKESTSGSNNNDDDDDIVTLLQDILETVVARQEHPGLGGLSDGPHSHMISTLGEGHSVDNLKALEDSLGLNHATLSSTRDDLSTISSSPSIGNYSVVGVDKKSVPENSSKLITGDLERAVQRSRLTNKKRRKQLSKKASTTDTCTGAAVALSHILLTGPSKKQNKAATKNKKQVGIALRAITSYKEEVSLSNKKNKKWLR
jgi:hypothetical protein